MSSTTEHTYTIRLLRTLQVYYSSTVTNTHSYSESHKSNPHPQTVFSYIFRRSVRYKAFGQARGLCFLTCCIHSVRGCFSPTQPPAWTAIPFAINSQLLSICGSSLLHQQYDGVACAGNTGRSCRYKKKNYANFCLPRKFKTFHINNLVKCKSDEADGPVCPVCESN